MKKILLTSLLVTAFGGIAAHDDYDMDALYDTDYQGASFGREYYDKLIDKATERHWAVPLAFHVDLAYKAFDACGDCLTLGEFVLGKGITLKDIYLLSKLSVDNKIRTLNEPAHEFQRPSGDGNDWGTFASDLFTTILAPMEINFTADQKEYGAQVTSAYRFMMGKTERSVGVVGINIPLKSLEHRLDLQLQDGFLYNEILPTNETGRNDPMKQFFKEFEDVYDFLVRAVFEPKGLSYCPLQRKTGFGDVSLFGYLDLAEYFDHADAFQVGLNIVFPSGRTAQCNKLFEPVLGCGTYQFNPFFSAIFTTGLCAINPAIKLAAEISARHTALRRIPHVVSSNVGSPPVRAQLHNVDGLIVSVNSLVDFYVDNFSEFDTIFPAFADTTTPARTKVGTKVLVGVANYVYDLFNLGFRLGMFYDYTRKSQDCVTPVCTPESRDSFNVKALQDGTLARAHRIGWNLTYKFENMIELNIGSQHVVAGRNVPQVHEVFASLIAVF